MVQLIKPKTQGRNELCDCGSGKKFKACCGRAPGRNLTPVGWARVMGKIIKDMGGEYEITFAALQTALDKDEAVGCAHNRETDTFMFKVGKVEKKSLILTPDKRVIG